MEDDWKRQINLFANRRAKLHWAWMRVFFINHRIWTTIPQSLCLIFNWNKKKGIWPFSQHYYYFFIYILLSHIHGCVFIVLQVKMKSDFLSPLQGQVEASVTLQAAPPEDAEFYVVVQGSALTHVTRAKRGADTLSLSFIVPGSLLSWFFSQISISFHGCGR